MYVFKMTVILVISIILGVVAQPLAAQNDTGGEPATFEEIALEEVIVTARRRQESI